MSNITIGILAHVDAGKTTLSERMLYETGAVKNVGRVDHGDAFLDTYELEKKRGITIFSKQATFSLGEEYNVTLLDTPGHVDFSAEMERTLAVLDYAILVVSAIDKVQGHTKTVWELLERYNVPTFIFVNKMDQAGVDKSACLFDLQKKLSGECIDFAGESEDLYENISLCDESALEEFLERENVSLTTIKRLVKERKVFPCYFGAALKGDGVKEFLSGLEDYIEPNKYVNDFGAKVFKITRDEKNNRLTHIKVTGGTVLPRMEISIDGVVEKVNQIRVYSGVKYDAVNEAKSGVICAVTGLTKTYPGQGLGNEADDDNPVLEPVLTYKIILPDEVNVSAFLPKLMTIDEEQPELKITWNESLQEIQAQVMGEVQIEILQSLISERFGVDVTFGQGNIIYKETISNTVEGVGHYEPLRHYAEAHLLLEPMPEGSGIVVDANVPEDKLDKNWQRLIITHILEKEHKGVLIGAPITDMKITVVGGRAHLKHTEGGDFRQATYRAIRQGLMQADSCILEPYYSFRLELPQEMIGRGMTDIEKMAGTFSLSEEGEEDMAVLVGSAPVKNMQDYGREVVSYSKGKGKLYCTVEGYKPCHNAEHIIAARQYNPDADEANPSGSVFCSHGAGFFVPWNEVKNYMHVEGYSLNEKSDESEMDMTPVNLRKEEEFMSVEEVDAIIERSSMSNKNSKPKPKRQIGKVEGLSKPRKKPIKLGKYLLVDGYNIIFAWDELKKLASDNIDSARDKLADVLCNYQGYIGDEVILVFDAYRVQNHKTEYYDYHNIKIVFTKEAETADQYIEKFTNENGKKYDITVATSDGLEQIIIRGHGAKLVSARELKERIEHQNQLLKNNYTSE